jgi:MYXO-CTERM domain-containing protein
MQLFSHQPHPLSRSKASIMARFWRKPWWVVLAAGWGVLGVSGQAEAFCRSTTCLDDNCKTDVNGCNTTDKPLFWKSSCVGVSMQKTPGLTIPDSSLNDTLNAAMAAWNNIQCPAGGPLSIKLERQPDVPCTDAFFNKTGKNVNGVLFRSVEWPYPGNQNTLGFTTVTFSVQDGEILDADIEINATPSGQLTVGDSQVRNDLQSILTHELGHFIGMAHTNSKGATMVPFYVPHTVSLRDLEADDIAGACEAYPSDRNAECSLTPYGGLGDSCVTPSEEKPKDEGCGCRLSEGTPANRSPYLFSSLLLLAGLARRRRKP